MTTTLPARRPLVPEDLVRPGRPPGQAFYRAAAAHVKADESRSPSTIARQAWPRDEAVQTVLRAASAPADSTTTGWASQLTETSNSAWISSLKPSIFAQLVPFGIQLSLDGPVLIPGRDASPSIAGSFVVEGGVIPTRRLALNSITLLPKTLKVITSLTSEIRRLSAPNLELVLQAEIAADNAAVVDSLLLDATAATSVRPGGLRAGVSGLTATVGGGFNALVGDVKQLIAGIAPAKNPVIIANPVQAVSIALTQAGSLAGGGFPVIQASSVTPGMVIAVDAADFVVATKSPMFAASEEALWHEENTTPLAIGTVGSPATVAAPVRSAFQTDSIALRVVWPLNWALRRSAAVAWTSSITW